MAAPSVPGTAPARTPVLAGLAFVACLGAVAPGPACAAPAEEGWAATRMLSAGDVLRPEDVEIRKPDQPAHGLFPVERSPIGLEAKRRVLEGRFLSERDVGRHPLVRANAPILVVWRSGGIAMQLQGRALQEGAAGDQIRVLNTASSRTLAGIVQPDGTVLVGGGE